MTLKGSMLRYLRSAAAFDAEGAAGGGGGGDVKPAADPAKPAADPAASVLFPAEGGDKKPAPAAGDHPKADDQKPEDWKEYVPDPKKSEAENAAAKVEHDKTKPAAADPADTVPADGKYVLKMPEGVKVDQAMVDALGPDFKELGLTSKQAQKLADKFVEVQQKRAADQGTAWAARVAGWAEEAKADKDIGGDKWDGTVKNATRAVNALGTPELKDYLETTGGGNHPELIRFMAKVGAMIREDVPASGGAGGNGKPADAAYTLFPNDVPKGN
ncbi:hypothetical protein ACQR1I_35930 [Bradyrhizobium sp. HKCCYLS2038]|uniref:hypothetical protein n=1 Tax=Bradyrhizobium sp. HKCCYLS2038 TaxID=3420764 RepID=UPI003EBBF7C4